MTRRSTGDVALVIAARDAAETIGTTLGSVAGQTRPVSAVVVVDDASEDDTASEARVWDAVLPIEVVRLSDNHGPARARSEAIARTSTPLIVVVDADDVLLPDHVETLVSAYEASAGGLITPQPLHWVPGIGVGGAPPAKWRDVPPLRDQLRELLVENFVFTAVLFARADYERAGGFRDALRRSEDWDLWIRMVRQGVPVHRTDHATVLYRISPGSLSFGYATAEWELEVMRLALEEASTDEERAWAERGLRRRRARAGLKEAFELASEGHPWKARRTALGALSGAPRVAVQAAAMTLSPAVTARSHRRRMARVERLL